MLMIRTRFSVERYEMEVLQDCNRKNKKSAFAYCSSDLILRSWKEGIYARIHAKVRLREHFKS
jgi:hypothetical protein